MAYKKGQLSADFYIALIVFLGVIAYITFQLFQTIPASSANLKEESVRIEAYQISELLVNDGGHPVGWYDTAKYPAVDNIKRIGLSDSIKNITNFISRQKIDRLKNICESPTGYQDVKRILDVQDEMNITFIEHTSPQDTRWVCKSPVPLNKKNAFSISRVVSIDGTTSAEIIVEVWKT